MSFRRSAMTSPPLFPSSFAAATDLEIDEYRHRGLQLGRLMKRKTFLLLGEPNRMLRVKFRNPFSTNEAGPCLRV
jgi:hypothetical protein